MIGLKEFATKIQSQLNIKALGSGYQFIVHSDTGEFEKARRSGNSVIEKINCSLTLTGSDNTTIANGSVVATQDCRLTVVFRLPDDEEDTIYEGVTYKGAKTKIADIRRILDSVVSIPFTDEMTDGDKHFLLVGVYQYANSGSRNQLQELGKSFSFGINAYFMLIENGISAKDNKFYLDGIEVPFSGFTITRVPTLTPFITSSTVTGSTKNISLQSSLTLSFELPAFVDDTTEKLTNYLLEGEQNSVHLLTIVRSLSYNNYKIRSYLVTFGDITQSGETIKNVGQRLTLVEAHDDYELVNVGDLFVYSVGVGKTLTIQSDKPSTVYDFTSHTSGQITYGEVSSQVFKYTTTLTVAQGDIIVSVNEIIDDDLTRL